MAVARAAAWRWRGPQHGGGAGRSMATAAHLVQALAVERLRGEVGESLEEAAAGGPKHVETFLEELERAHLHRAVGAGGLERRRVRLGRRDAQAGGWVDVEMAQQLQRRIRRVAWLHGQRVARSILLPPAAHVQGQVPDFPPAAHRREQLVTQHTGAVGVALACGGCRGRRRDARG